MILENVTYDSLKELPRYDPLYPVYGAGESETVVPFNVNDENKYPGLLLVNTNGDNLYITDWDEISQIKDKPGFEWVDEPFKLFKEEFDNTFSKDAQRNYLMEQFRLANGILGLCEIGEADSAAYSLMGKRANQEGVSDTIKSAFNNPHGERLGGSSLNSYYAQDELRVPIVALNAKSYMSKYISNSTLLHEFTHQMDFTINILSNSSLFNAILKIESLSDSTILNFQLEKMNRLIKENLYTPEKKNVELIARLHEQKLKYPDEFKKQLPLLNDFYEQIAYSYLEHTLTKSTHAIMHLNDYVQHPYSVRNNGYSSHVLPNTDDKRAIKWESEYYNKAVETEKNAGWKTKPDGSRSRNLSDPEVIRSKEQLKIAENARNRTLNTLRNNLSQGIEKVFKESHNIALAEMNNQQIPSYYKPSFTRSTPLEEMTIKQIRSTQEAFLALKFAPESEKNNFEAQYKTKLKALSDALIEQFKISYPKYPEFIADSLFEFASLDKNMTHKGDTPAILKNAKLLSEQMRYPYSQQTLFELARIAKNEPNVNVAYQKIKAIETDYQRQMTPSLDIPKKMELNGGKKTPIPSSGENNFDVSSPIRPNQQYSTLLQHEVTDSQKPIHAPKPNISHAQEGTLTNVAPPIKFQEPRQEPLSPISAPMRPTVLDKKLAQMPKPIVASTEIPKKITKIR